MRTELGDSRTDALKQLEEHDFYRFLLISDTLTSVKFLDEFSRNHTKLKKNATDIGDFFRTKQAL